VITTLRPCNTGHSAKDIHKLPVDMHAKRLHATVVVLVNLVRLSRVISY